MRKTTPDRGTTLSVTLPTCPNSALESAGHLSDAEAQHHGHVLIVDDEIIVRQTARALLEDMGFDVEEAVNGEEAIKAVAGAAHPFDVVLLDATMPGLDARQTLCGLRKLSSTLPILLCTGYSRLEFCDELEGDTHLDYLAKPYRVKELTSKIEHMIDPTAS